MPRLFITFKKDTRYLPISFSPCAFVSRTVTLVYRSGCAIFSPLNYWYPPGRTHIVITTRWIFLRELLPRKLIGCSQIWRFGLLIHKYFPGDGPEINITVNSVFNNTTVENARALLSQELFLNCIRLNVKNTQYEVYII